MKPLMTTALMSAALLASSGLAPAQEVVHSHNISKQVIETPEQTIKLAISDGAPLLTINGDKISIPSLDGDWTEYEVIGEDGKVLCVLTRPEPGSPRIAVGMPGMPTNFSTTFGNPMRNMVMGGVTEPRGAYSFAIAPEAPEQPRVMIGVRLSSEIPANIARLGFDPTKATSITYVVPGAPAEKAGLKAGDVIVGIGGAQAGNSNAITKMLSSKDPGDTLEIVLVRDDQIETKSVVLSEFKAQAFQEQARLQRAPATPEVLEERLSKIQAEIERYKMKIALSQDEIAELDDAEKLRDLATTIRDMSMRIAALNRERAEMLAQTEALRAASERNRFFADDELLSLEIAPEDVRRRINLPNQLGLSGRVFIQGDEGDPPFIIERDLPLNEIVRADQVEAWLNGTLNTIIDGRLENIEELLEDVELGRLLNTQREGAGEAIEEVEVLLDRSEGRIERLQDQVEELTNANNALEERLERIERLLERLLDS